MNFVIPMAGRGKRFLEAGYDLPKMLITAKGKTLLQWSLDSLPLELCTNLVFVGLAEHEQGYSLQKKTEEIYGTLGCEIRWKWLKDVTGGQAETVLAAGELLALDDPLLIFNIDTAFYSRTIKETVSRKDIDGVLGAFSASSEKYSYAAINAEGYVNEVAEKVPISPHALTGLYHFSRAVDFFVVAEEAVNAKETIRGEYYVAPMYNRLIAAGKKYVLDFCDRITVLGTPEELTAFENA